MLKKTISSRKKYNITNKMIADWLNYSSVASFNSSSAKNRILKAIDKVAAHVEEKILEKLTC